MPEGDTVVGEGVGLCGLSVLGPGPGGDIAGVSCGGCEEGDFNVHNLLCISGNEDGGFGCCRRGDICSLTELDCIYPE